MKALIVFMILIFSMQIVGQSNKATENELYNHFKKTRNVYYKSDVNYDQVGSENKIFITRLTKYLEDEPNSIESNLVAFPKSAKFNIISSQDGNFRIYNWAINLGGHYSTYYNIIQYRFKDKHGVLGNEDDYAVNGKVIKIFQANLNGKQYYFPYIIGEQGNPLEQSVGSFLISSKGISSGKNLFETELGEFSSSIGFAYHRTDIFNNNGCQINFNEYTNTFTVPVVYPETLEMTTETALYEFDGNKFKRKPDYDNIEGDLFSHFSRMMYWNERDFSEERQKIIRMENDYFKSKLIYYTTKYPELIDYDFYKLVEAGLAIKTSKDGKFKSYSWSNNITSILFSNDWNVCLYSDGKHSKAFSEQVGDVLDVFDLKMNNVNYYLVLYHYNGMGGTRTRYQKLVAYEGTTILPDIYGLPNDNKNSTGKGISAFYDYFTLNEKEEIPIKKAIKFYAANNVISVQQKNHETYKLNNKFIKYKFDGYSFKKMK